MCCAVIQCSGLVCLISVPLQVPIMSLYMSAQTEITCRNVCLLFYNGCHTRWCQNWLRRLCPVLCWLLLESLSLPLFLSLPPCSSLSLCPLSLFFSLFPSSFTDDQREKIWQARSRKNIKPEWTLSGELANKSILPLLITETGLVSHQCFPRSRVPLGQFKSQNKG